MKNKLIKIGAFARRHQTAILMGTAAGITIVLQQKMLQTHWRFLDEKSLNDEFYASLVKK